MESKKDLVFIKHMIESIENIEKFTKDVEYREFFENDMMNSAVIRKIEILGEATSKLSIDFRKKYKEVPWQIIKDMRNMLIHEYFGVDIQTIWNTVKINIPVLYTQLLEIIEKEEKGV
ncbi:MAG: HepT-like ribonuclease domain-containing protein [Fusobacteriaceae bacterium]